MFVPALEVGLFVGDREGLEVGGGVGCWGEGVGILALGTVCGYETEYASLLLFFILKISLPNPLSFRRDWFFLRFSEST